MNTCVCCGAPIPEGRQVCPQCEDSVEPDAILKDGTPLWLNPTAERTWSSMQWELYSNLMNYKRAMQEDD